MNNIIQRIQILLQAHLRWATIGLNLFLLNSCSSPAPTSLNETIETGANGQRSCVDLSHMSGGSRIPSPSQSENFGFASANDAPLTLGHTTPDVTGIIISPALNINLRHPDYIYTLYVASPLKTLPTIRSFRQSVEVPVKPSSSSIESNNIISTDLINQDRMISSYIIEAKDSTLLMVKFCNSYKH